MVILITIMYSYTWRYTRMDVLSLFAIANLESYERMKLLYYKMAEIFEIILVSMRPFNRKQRDLMETLRGQMERSPISLQVCQFRGAGPSNGANL